MKLIKKLLHKFNGMHYPHEYLCLARESFQQPLHAWLIYHGTVFKDITNLHCFVGYSPMVFAFSSSVFRDLPDREIIQIAFTSFPLQQNVPFDKKDAIALLKLKVIPDNFDEKIVAIYEGLKGKHRFLSLFHQYIFQLHNDLYGKRPGNVFLKGNLYSQVQIAYSIPRKICLITVGENTLFNLFPTDLHGQINGQYYLISLRHGGMACRQVESSGKIVLSDMNANACKMVYSLGKNHMQPLKDRSFFDFSNTWSKNFHLPLPNHRAGYKELELVSFFTCGIHKLLLFRIVHDESPDGEHNTLAHIHNSYATWRYNKGLESNYLGL